MTVFLIVLAITNWIVLAMILTRIYSETNPDETFSSLFAAWWTIPAAIATFAGLVSYFWSLI